MGRFDNKHDSETARKNKGHTKDRQDMKRARFLLATTALGLNVSFAGAVHAETLREALAAAYYSNPDLAAARAEQRSVDEAVPAAVSNWRPNISGQVQLFESDISSTTVRGTDGTIVNDNDFSGSNEVYSARVDQQIFRGMRNFNQYKGAKSEVMAGRANLLSTEQQVLLDAVTAYMDVLRDMAVVRLNDNNVQVLTRQLEATQDRFRVGEVTRTDVAQAEAALAGSRSTRIQAQATLETSRAVYRRIIGMYPGTLEDAPELPPLPQSEDMAVEVALDENPLVVSARHVEQAAKYDVKEAKGGILPTVSAFADWSRRESPTLTFDPVPNSFVNASNVGESTRYGITIDIPLYQSGAEYSTVRRAKQINSQRRLQIVSAERQVMQNVRVAWENYRAAQASIEATSAQVRANEIALEGVRQEASVGSRTTLDVLDAEQILLDSRVNLVTARRNEYVAGFSVLEAVGRLNAASLNLPVELYQPEEYYKSVKWKLVGWGTGDKDDSE
ncbi:type I secretion protein TolC [Iodidimonas muriae]|uniref:Type I secretion protein TolC n=2 Tax=Iodidimonas muriae TaxID=261467 RepID=A0ABQ2LFB9_9PROT|nr:type I secretion protein TolC [Iodidimonas muriae]